jgi:WD40 repeat protein
VKIFSGEKLLASRGLDDTMKLWDLRKATQPIFTWNDLTNYKNKTNITCSPDEKFVLTGTSVKTGHGFGHVVAFDVKTGGLVESIPISKASVVAVLWHEEIN